MFPEVSILQVALLDAWVRNQWKTREKHDFATKVLFHVLFQTGMLVPCQACVLGHCVLCGPAATCTRQCASWKSCFLHGSERHVISLAGRGRKNPHCLLQELLSSSPCHRGRPLWVQYESRRLLPSAATGQSTSCKTLLLLVTSPVTDESQDRASVNHDSGEVSSTHALRARCAADAHLHAI